MPLRPFLQSIRDALGKATGLDPDSLVIETPRDVGLGHFAFPCFLLARTRRAPPPKIAAEIADEVDGQLEGIRATAAGPYVNFRVDGELLARSVVEAIEQRGPEYGRSDVGAGKTVVVDLCSPNIAKPMHVGHLRSTIIGAAIQRLHQALGYRAVSINHIGDWGSQFGKLVVAIDRWGDTAEIDRDPIKKLLELYVRYHAEEENDPSLKEAARAAFRELESGEEGEVRATWRKVTELSLREFDAICTRLGVTFDLVRGEAYYEPYLRSTIERIVEAGVTEESDGALIVDLSSIEKGMAPCLLRKSDGTTLYATRDLAAVFHRWEEFAFDRALYVVGSDQKLHFRQLRGVLHRMGLEYEERVEHVNFGLMRLPEGKISTRKGQVVFLNDVLDRAVEEARKVIQEKNPDLADADAVAEQVGIGAVVFNDLKRERVKDVEFVWEEVLSFEGETGPYVQYTHARLASILRKAANLDGGVEADLSLLEDAGSILARLGRFPDVLASAARRAEPSELTLYLLTLCRELNSWYVEHRVLGVDPPLQEARLTLIRASKSVLDNGLRILGVASPEEM